MYEKLEYTEPKLFITTFDCEDIITASGGDNLLSTSGVGDNILDFSSLSDMLDL